ncbi:unnamed protein product [Callosobruchus maculatus]|uniref:Chitin-binding type-2 domain-containing protein n=1 Tax=Callosobruchus maculatus TaxID=64391 RepID=A0A653DHA1_CALMS|nr:unnamed protein product [Callosobruchus maculatus]
MFSFITTSVFFVCVVLSKGDYSNPYLIGGGHAQNALVEIPSIPTSRLSTNRDLRNQLSATDNEMRKFCKGETGLFRGLTCNKFVHCWNGNAVEQDCPEGLFFNSKGYCDFPQNVDCNEVSPTVSSASAAKGDSGSWSPPSPPPPSVQSTDSVTSPPGVIRPQNTLLSVSSSPSSRLGKSCRKARGQFASAYCDKYINCWDGQAIEEKCPSGLLFSDQGYCDFPQNVNCGGRIIGEAVHPQQVPDKVQGQGVLNETPPECPLPSGTFRDKTKCNKYFTCIANQVVARQECPQGLVFNDFLGVCDFNSRVDCSKEPVYFQSAKKNDISYNSDSRNTECTVELGAFRDLRNCSTFYICVSNKLVAKYNCPEGLSFNDDLGICDYSKNVNCWLPPKVFKAKQNFIQTLPPELMQKIRTCQVGSSFPLNPQCTAMCLCKEEAAEIVQCPAALAYDIRTDKCVLPHIARC